MIVNNNNNNNNNNINNINNNNSTLNSPFLTLACHYSTPHHSINIPVMFAYEQCFLCLGLHPDVWIEAATFLEDSSKMLNERGSNVAGKMFAEEASGIYERALSMGLKNCLLIYFAYADMEEVRSVFMIVMSVNNCES